jgi:hypothetical protein
MVPYVAVVVRGEDETWRAYLPDFSGCRANGESVETALARAKNQARESNSGAERPTPRGLMEIRDDLTWARDRNVDWQDAIVVMVELWTLREDQTVKERSWLTELDRISLKPTRQAGTKQSPESTERDRAFDARAAAIEKLKRQRVKND